MNATHTDSNSVRAAQLPFQLVATSVTHPGKLLLEMPRVQMFGGRGT